MNVIVQKAILFFYRLVISVSPWHFILPTQFKSIVKKLFVAVYVYGSASPLLIRILNVAQFSFIDSTLKKVLSPWVPFELYGSVHIALLQQAYKLNGLVL